MIADCVQIVVGISDAKASSSPDDVLTTYSLGSCIGVALYDPIKLVGGMLHYQLPSSSADLARAQERPLMYADTGMAWLLEKMVCMGAHKRRLRVYLAGAAQMLNDSSLFDIGRRNHAAIRKFFWQQGMLINGEQVGGKLARTMQLSIADGTVSIKCNGELFTL